MQKSNADIALEVLRHEASLNSKELSFVESSIRHKWRGSDLLLTKRQAGWLRAIHRHVTKEAEDSFRIFEDDDASTGGVDRAA